MSELQAAHRDSTHEFVCGTMAEVAMTHEVCAICKIEPGEESDRFIP
jgi:hypothetical protein